MPVNVTRGQPFDDEVQMQTSYACSLWVLTRADGVVERFTNWDENLDVQGFEVFGVFNSVGGIAQDAVSRESGLRSATTSAVGVLDGLDEELLAGGVYNNAKIVEYEVDARWPHSKGQRVEEWYVVNVEWSTDHWRFELEGPGRLLKEVQGRPFARDCGHSLGEGGCKGPSVNNHGVDIADYTYGASTPLTISWVNPDYPRQAFKVYLNSGTNPLDSTRDTFAYGKVRFVTTSNKNLGMEYEILSHDKAGILWPQSGEFVLYQETVVDLKVGDRLEIEEGCDGKIETCIGLPLNQSLPLVTGFRNWENFDGDRWIPGTQKARQSAAINWQR